MGRQTHTEMNDKKLNLNIGDVVIIKQGATVWMKKNGYWLDEWPDSIDGMKMTVLHDYTHLEGNDAHFWCANETVKDCGINPNFISTKN